MYFVPHGILVQYHSISMCELVIPTDPCRHMNVLLAYWVQSSITRTREEAAARQYYLS